MISKESFSQLMSAIVAEQIPEEVLVFRAEGASLVDEVYRGGAGSVPKGPRSPFGFGAEVKAALELIPVLWGTYKVLKEVAVSVQPKPDQEAIARKWMKALVDAGLPERRAMAIVARFRKDVTALAERKTTAE